MTRRTLSRLASTMALARTGRGDLKCPEQSLKLRQCVVPQLAAGDDLRHRFLLFVARPRRSRPFLRPVCDHRQGKALPEAARSGLKIRRYREEDRCPRDARTAAGDASTGENPQISLDVW
jgi:hypothetical protein